MSFTELVGASAWPWLAAVFYTAGSIVNFAATLIISGNPRAWVRASNGIFGLVIGVYWWWLALSPGLDRQAWSEGLTPWSTFAGIMGVGCLGAIHDFAIWKAHRAQGIT